MSNIDKQALRDALKKINIEQWSTRFNGDGYEVGVKGSGYCFYIVVAQDVADKNTANFIAAASPATIEVLLDELDAKDRRITELEREQVAMEAVTLAMRDEMRTAPPMPIVPNGWVMVPIEPTEDMIVEGFESEPDETFSDPDVWEAYEAMSGCQQAAYRAKQCWAAMIAAAPHRGSESVNKSELLQNIAALASACHKLASELEIGNERTEMFGIYEVLRRIQRSGAAAEMLAQTNPLPISVISEEGDV